MAKYRPLGIIQKISGSVGDMTFSHWKGVPTISKKGGKRLTNTEAQQKVKKIFSELVREWGNLNLKEWALWEAYAKEWKRTKNRRRNGLIPVIGGKMGGINAYMSVNSLLIRCGFKPIKIPIFRKEPIPPPPSTDLRNYGTYEGKIKFNIWLPHAYKEKCTAQIWMKKMEKAAYPYIQNIVEITTSPTPIVIDKIREQKNKNIVEIDIGKGRKRRLILQFRTVAENGKFSVPTHLYRIKTL